MPGWELCYQAVRGNIALPRQSAPMCSYLDFIYSNSNQRCKNKGLSCEIQAWIKKLSAWG